MDYSEKTRLAVKGTVCGIAAAIRRPTLVPAYFIGL